MGGSVTPRARARSIRGQRRLVVGGGGRGALCDRDAPLLEPLKEKTRDPFCDTNHDERTFAIGMHRYSGCFRRPKS